MQFDGLLEWSAVTAHAYCKRALIRISTAQNFHIFYSNANFQCIYIFWATCSMILVIWSDSYCNSHADKCYADYCQYGNNDKQCKNGQITVNSFRLKGAGKTYIFL